MKTPVKMTIAAAGMIGAAMFAAGPARADGFSISIGVPGIGFSYGSGGFCDDWGCPRSYWDYPVYYGPVYFHDVWYRGPVYYRVIDGDDWYWVHGGWHRDQWHGPRPAWWGRYRHGPALGYSFYTSHGFRHDHDRYWRGDAWQSPGWEDRHRGMDRHEGSRRDWRNGDRRDWGDGSRRERAGEEDRFSPAASDTREDRRRSFSRQDRGQPQVETDAKRAPHRRDAGGRNRDTHQDQN